MPTFYVEVNFKTETNLARSHQSLSLAQVWVWEWNYDLISEAE